MDTINRNYDKLIKHRPEGHLKTEIRALSNISNKLLDLLIDSQEAFYFETLILPKDKLKEYRGIYRIIGTVICAVSILLLPLIGVIKLSPQALTLGRLAPSFWVSSFLLLLGSIFINMASQEAYLDKRGIVIKKILPYLLISALYVFIIPYIKPRLILALFPVALVAFSYWYFSTIFSELASQPYGLV